MKKSIQSHKCTLTADAVCEALRISPATLYAYVSRGYIRAIQQPGDARRSLYDERDVHALSERKRVGRSRRNVATSTIDWGEPVLTSSITQIIDGQFYYRGTLATELSKTMTLEAVASKLIDAPVTHAGAYLPDFMASEDILPFQRLLSAFSDDIPINHSARDARQSGRLLRLAALSAAGGKDTKGLPIHELLAQAWARDKAASDLIRRALVLCADHELNASTYAARIAASAGSSMQACILVGLATLSGAQHGGLTDACSTWMQQVEKSTNPTRLIRNRLRRGEPPGFGHHLYPDGDPRALELMETAGLPDSWQRVVRLVAEETGAHPVLDFGLALVQRQLALPNGAGLAIFAVGRTAGWIAHILEQRRTGRLIRPRAAYGAPA